MCFFRCSPSLYLSCVVITFKSQSWELVWEAEMVFWRFSRLFAVWMKGFLTCFMFVVSVQVEGKVLWLARREPKSGGLITIKSVHIDVTVCHFKDRSCAFIDGHWQFTETIWDTAALDNFLLYHYTKTPHFNWGCQRLSVWFIEAWRKGNTCKTG